MVAIRFTKGTLFTFSKEGGIIYVDPDVFRTINTLRCYPDDWRSKNFYAGLVQRNGRASDCIGCGQCESVCPQHLPIIELMKEAAGILDQK